MAKISISKVLETRRKIRILTVLASFLVIIMLMQGFVFNNPKSSKAAFLDFEGRISATGNYFIDTQGKIYSFSDGDIYEEKGSVIDKELVLGANSKLTFAGGQIKLKSFDVGANSYVTHFGPSKTATSVSVREDYFGAVIEGWFKARGNGLALIRTEDHSRVVLTSQSGALISGTSVPNGFYTETRFTGLVDQAWYRFKVYYIGVTGTDTFDIYPDSTNSGQKFILDELNADGPNIEGSEGNVYATYFVPSGVENRACSDVNATIGTPGSDISGCFNADNIASTKILKSLFVNSYDRVCWKECEFYGNGRRVCTWVCEEGGEPTGLVYGGLKFQGGDTWWPWISHEMGANKGIFLDIERSFTLGAGARIDVSGKGYQGGESIGGGNNGYGPGKGLTYGAGSGADGDSPGSGGGHGGKGGLTVGNGTPISNGGVANDSITEPIEMGSGGAAGHPNGTEEYPGGDGGGIVKITAGSINIVSNVKGAIDANGLSAYKWFDSWSKSGGGAGGTINLNSRGSFSIGTSSDILTARGGRGGIEDSETPGDGGGGRIALKAQNFTGPSLDQLMQGDQACPDRIWYNRMTGFNTGDQPCSIQPIVNVYPFRWGDYNGDGDEDERYVTAGRGTVYVSSSLSAFNNIKKTLEPVKRDGKSDTTFNPYALKVGDVIRVKIELSNLRPGEPINVTDELLKTVGSGAYVCKKPRSSLDLEFFPVEPDDFGSSLSFVWSDIVPPNNTTSLIIFYKCEVQQ